MRNNQHTFYKAVLVTLALTISSIAYAVDTPSMKDRMIHSKLWAFMVADASLNPLEMDIDVNDQVVKLHGTVANQAEKNLAGSIAEGIKGVRDVENYLVIDKDHTRPNADDSIWQDMKNELSDRAITTAVTTKLLANRHVSGFDVNVDTNEGHVTLIGSVSDEDAKKIAESLATGTRGVTKVTNELKLDNGADGNRQLKREELATLIDDSWIKTKVASQYAFSSGVDLHEIDLDVKKGVVYLSGQVSNKSERELAYKIAEDTLGVKKVHAKQLKLK